MNMTITINTGLVEIIAEVEDLQEVPAVVTSMQQAACELMKTFVPDPATTAADTRGV